MARSRRNSDRRRGNSIIELSLTLPWLLFLFSGAMDMGFYAYSLISAENAARAAVLYTSASTTSAADAGTACTYVLAEMNSLANVRNLSTCDAAPLVVTATSVTGPDGFPASQVSVTYTTVTLVRIPGLPGTVTVTRTAQMRVNTVS